jgi:hypothetical protein
MSQATAFAVVAIGKGSEHVATVKTMTGDKLGRLV